MWAREVLMAAGGWGGATEQGRLLAVCLLEARGRKNLDVVAYREPH